MSEDPSKPKRPFFSPFAKELIELILKSLAPESDSKPKRTRRKLPGERKRERRKSTGGERRIRRGGGPDIGNSRHRPGSRGSWSSGPLTSPYERKEGSGSIGLTFRN